MCVVTVTNYDVDPVRRCCRGTCRLSVPFGPRNPGRELVDISNLVKIFTLASRPTTADVLVFGEKVTRAY